MSSSDFGDWEVQGWCWQVEYLERTPPVGSHMGHFSYVLMWWKGTVLREHLQCGFNLMIYNYFPVAPIF